MITLNLLMLFSRIAMALPNTYEGPPRDTRIISSSITVPVSFSGTAAVGIISTFSATNPGYVVSPTSAPVNAYVIGNVPVLLISTFSAANPGYVNAVTSFPVNAYQSGSWTTSISGVPYVILVGTFTSSNPGYITVGSSLPVNAYVSGSLPVNIVSTFSAANPGYVVTVGTVIANAGTGSFSVTGSTTYVVEAGFYASSQTFTGTANGTVIDPSSHTVKSYAIQVTGIGAAATTWDIRLEGTLDGVNYTQILQHTNTTGDGTTLYSGATLSPSRFFRVRVAGLVLGSAGGVVVQSLGVP